MTRSRSTVSKLFKDIVDSDYPNVAPIVDQLISPGETGLLIARQKEGKSTLALQLAVDVSCGEPFLGQYKTQRCLVTYVDYENRPYRLKDRAIDVARGRRLDNVTFRTFDNISERDVALLGEQFEKLQNMVEEIRPGLLIIDPLRLAIDKDSSDERSAVEALDQAARLKGVNPELAILLVHHVKKNQDNLTLDLRTDPRSWIDKIYGSQALLAHAENIWGLEHDDLGYAFGAVSRSEETFVIGLEKEPGSQRFRVSDQPVQLANLPQALREAWEQLPEGFSRGEGLALGIANNTLDRLIRQAKPMGLLGQDPKTKRYQKRAGQKVVLVGNSQ